MSLRPKEIPPPILGKLIPPERGRAYFENCAALPFESETRIFSTRNAWWLAEASFLAYQTPEDPLNSTALIQVGCTVEFFRTPSTQALLVCGDTFLILAFCGTRFKGIGNPDGLLRLELVRWRDLVTDLKIGLLPFGTRGRVHKGVKEALDECWQRIKTRIAELQGDNSRSIWLAGHSLGGALATLAATDCVPQGLYTFGSPKVGDQSFAATFCVPNAYRLINAKDLVPQMPPGRLYTHVGTAKYLDDAGSISGSQTSHEDPESFQARAHFETEIADAFLQGFNALNADQYPVISKAFADHAPVYYANHLFNCAIKNPISTSS